MKKLKDFYKSYRHIIWTILGIVGVFLIWWILSLILKTTLFPGPGKVLPQFFIYLGEGKTYLALGGTLLRLLISIVAGFVFGLLLGIIAGLNEAFRSFIRPLIIVFRTIPTAAVIYILIVLMSPKYAPIIIVFLMTFPILYESIVSGMTSIDQNIIDAASMDGAKTLQKVFRVYLPLSWNYIVLGVVSSVGLGMKVAIMSEILAGTDSADGLGKLIRSASLTVDMTSIMAYALIAIIIIGLIDIAIHLAKKKLKASIGKK